MSDLHVRVTGVVQGVGYRWFVRERARRLGLAGWVRNLRDGTVEVVASGDPGQLDLLRGELERGPNGAMVDELQPIAEGPDRPFKDPFEIVR